VTSTVDAAPAAVQPDAGRPAPALSLLNGFELRCDGARVPLPMTAQRLLAFVALHDHVLLRVYVAGVLWTDTSEEKAGANLRSSLWRLHRPGFRLIDATSTHVRLSPDLDVDVHRALVLAHRLLGGSADSEDVDLEQAGLADELLPDWYDDWVLFERERFRQLGLHALEALVEQQLAAGRPRRALEAALAAVRGEPLRESAHRALIRVHLAERNAGEALRQYEECRRLLRERLGLEPSPELAALMRPLTR
jgi:DNA-binding SARP family transcriptional activator